MPWLWTADGKLHLRFGRKRVPLRLFPLRTSLRPGRKITRPLKQKKPCTLRGFLFLANR